MLIEHTSTDDSTVDRPAAQRPHIRGVLLGVAAAAIVFGLSRDFGFGLSTPLMAAGILGMTDQQTGRLPNKHNGLLFVITMFFLAVATFGAGYGSFPGALAGAAIWSMPLFVMAVIGSFGGGDFKFAASLGAMCGWISIPTAIIGLVVALSVCCIAGLIEAKRAGTMNTSVRLGLPLFLGTVGTIVVAAI